jgi:hypothetical protein
MGSPLEDLFASSNDAIAQLKQSAQPQSGLAGIDPVWLAAAQGFLSPTKTGGFGESVANAAGSVQAPLKAIKDQQMSAQDKIRAIQEANAKLWLQQQQLQKGDNENKADLQAAQAEYYRAHTANLSDKADLQSLHSLEQNYKTQLDALKSDLSAINQPNLTPQELQQKKAEKQDLLKRHKQVSDMIEKKLGIGIQAVEQPPMPGAKKGIDPNTGEQGWYIKQGDQMMKVQ